MSVSTTSVPKGIYALNSVFAIQNKKSFFFQYSHHYFLWYRLFSQQIYFLILYRLRLLLSALWFRFPKKHNSISFAFTRLSYNIKSGQSHQYVWHDLTRYFHYARRYRRLSASKSRYPFPSMLYSVNVLACPSCNAASISLSFCQVHATVRKNPLPISSPLPPVIPV